LAVRAFASGLTALAILFVLLAGALAPRAEAQLINLSCQDSVDCHIAQAVEFVCERYNLDDLECDAATSCVASDPEPQCREYVYGAVWNILGEENCSGIFCDPVGTACEGDCAELVLELSREYVQCEPDDGSCDVALEELVEAAVAAACQAAEGATSGACDDHVETCSTVDACVDSVMAALNEPTCVHPDVTCLPSTLAIVWTVVGLAGAGPGLAGTAMNELAATTFMVPTSLPLRTLEDHLATSPVSVSQIYHATSLSVGGYVFERSQNFFDGIDDYESIHAEDYPGDALMARGFVVRGAKTKADLAESLRPLVTEPSVRYLSVFQMTAAVDDPQEEALGDPAGAPGAYIKYIPDEPFTPLIGKVSAFHAAGKKRPNIIHESVKWDTGSLRHFERAGYFDHAYEHELKLMDDNPNRTSGQPFCWNEDDNYWARRNGLKWDTTFPKSAVPFLDDNLGEPCEFEDLTVGLVYPLNLTEQREYFIYLRSKAPSDPELENNFFLSAVKAMRLCGGSPETCVGSADSASRTDTLIGKTKGLLPGCREWRKFHYSRAC
jgi:hypothetical protein